MSKYSQKNDIRSALYLNITKMNGSGQKIWANASFSVQSKIFPKLKAQILQMRYQNVQEGSSFTVKRKKF